LKAFFYAVFERNRAEKEDFGAGSTEELEAGSQATTL
jgi:hypothetical protein